MDSNETIELRAALVRDCGLTPESNEPADADHLLKELARRVDYLLRHDGEKLMYYLYALDVAEDEIARAFAPGSADEPALKIARAMIEREAQRLRTRKKYEQQSGSGAKSEPPKLAD